MIDRLNRFLCYSRNHGARETWRLLLRKLTSGILRLGRKTPDIHSNRRGPCNALKLSISRFEAAIPLQIYTIPALDVRRVNVVTDSINAGSLFGGVGTSLIFGALLADSLGARLRIITRAERPRAGHIDHVLSVNGIALRQDVELAFAAYHHPKFEIDVADSDLFITTSWWTTAATMASVRHDSIIYLLQEDERLFYPFGDERLRCEQVMRSNDIRFLINTKLLFDHFVADGFDNVLQNGMWFEPAFPSEVFYPRTIQRKGKNRFFFYARPNYDRNLFYLGIEVVELAVANNVLNLDDWEIFLVGKDIPAVTFANGYAPERHENLTWSEYAELAGSIDVGLCLMYTPHPSYPPLDLAASGAVVVTNRFGKKQDLSNYSPNLICADLDRNELVRAIKVAVSVATNSRLRESNYRKNTLIADWRQSFARIIPKLADDIYPQRARTHSVASHELAAGAIPLCSHHRS